jgi:uncharacterized repeat protein (TIGR01451 family)
VSNNFGLVKPAVYDLSINKQYTGPSSVQLGSTGTYTLTVFNTGNVTGTNVDVVDILPSGMTLSSSAGALQNGVNTTGMIHWTIASLAPQSTATITMTVTYGSTGMQMNVAEVLPGSTP